MKKVLKIHQLIFYGLGMIIGSGIYSVIGKAAGIAGQNLWVSFLVAAVTAMLTALSYAELSSIFTKAGAEYIYVSRIFPSKEFLAFFCGAMMVFAGTSTSATVAVAFSGYLQQFFEVPIIPVALTVLTIFTLINLWGIKEASWVNVVFTIIEISGLVLIAVLGFRAGAFEKGLPEVKMSTEVWQASSLIIFSYFGFETIVNFADETQQPEKKIPRAIIVSLLISAILYMLVAISALGLASPAALSESDHPISSIVQKESPKSAIALGLIALFSTANTVLISLLSSSRVIFSMGREGDLPSQFSAQTKRHAPWVAAIIVFVFSSILLPVGGVEVLASASALATMLVFLIVNISLIFYRYSEPQAERPFKVPLNIGRFPVLPGLAALSSLSLLFFFSGVVYGLAAAVIIAVVISYFCIRKYLKHFA